MARLQNNSRRPSYNPHKGLIMISPPLYKTRKDGKVQIWWMEQSDNRIRSCSAQWDKSIVKTSLVTSEWKEIFGTNEGKSNERTPVEQAEFEIKKHYRMRMESGAVYQIGDKPMVADKISPMLSATYSNDPLLYELL